MSHPRQESYPTRRLGQGLKQAKAASRPDQLLPMAITTVEILSISFVLRLKSLLSYVRVTSPYLSVSTNTSSSVSDSVPSDSGDRAFNCSSNLGPSPLAIISNSRPSLRVCRAPLNSTVGAGPGKRARIF